MSISQDFTALAGKLINSGELREQAVAHGIPADYQQDTTKVLAALANQDKAAVIESLIAELADTVCFDAAAVEDACHSVLADLGSVEKQRSASTTIQSTMDLITSKLKSDINSTMYVGAEPLARLLDVTEDDAGMKAAFLAAITATPDHREKLASGAALNPNGVTELLVNRVGKALKIKL